MKLDNGVVYLAKKIPVNGKKYSRFFPFDRNFVGPVADPFSSQMVVRVVVAGRTVTEFHVFVQFLAAWFDISQILCGSFMHIACPQSSVFSAIYTMFPAR